MSAPFSATVVLVEFSDDLITLNRVVGIMRRRNLAVVSLSLGPAPGSGRRGLTAVLADDAATVSRLVNQLRKTSGVILALVRPENECLTREQMLVRVRVAPMHLAALLDAVALYDAHIIEESPEELLLEATGAAPLLGSLLRALEPFGVLAHARGGALALPRTPPSAAARRAATGPRAAKAVPA